MTDQNRVIFDNGIPLAPLLVEIYEKLGPNLKTNWDALTATDAPDNYFNWLNASAESEPPAGAEDFPLTNLMVEIRKHYSAPTLDALTDIKGKHRLHYLYWLATLGEFELQLDPVFVQPVKTFLHQWFWSDPQNPSQPRRFDYANLKIFLLSTPRTGNHWLQNILANAYNLPIKEATPLRAYMKLEQEEKETVVERLPFDPAEFAALGSRWIMYEHVRLNFEIIRWARENNVALVTTMRHPGDVAVSLYNYVLNITDKSSFSTDIVQVVRTDDPAERVRILNDYLKARLPRLLKVSLFWWLSGTAQLVRYEDLWQNPTQAVKEVTDSLLPLDNEKILRALILSDKDVIRQFDAHWNNFIYKGSSGNWRTELDPSTLSLLQTYNGLPEITRQMGYSFEPEIERQAESFGAIFNRYTHFENGTRAAALLVKHYLLLPTEVYENWTATDYKLPGAYLNWLNAPAENDPTPDSDLPVSRLAHLVWRERPDVQKVFPDLWQAHRADFLNWFVQYGASEFALENIFLDETRLNLLRQQNQALQAELSRLQTRIATLEAKLASRESIQAAASGNRLNTIARGLGKRIRNSLR
jgi:hypothetical protein